MQDRIALSEEVDNALTGGKPVVALESTVIAHGLPRPDNLETATAMEAAVRESGAVPATIAVLDGQIRIGLSDADRARLADPVAPVAKLSRRDLAAVLTSGGAGATTVAATMICAHATGIRCFATGGIGGVHRDAVEAMDISADLSELSRTPILTVCSGAKNILDLPKTREILEFLGVPVLGYRTDAFPAFHVRDSGLDVDRRIEDADQAADIAAAHWALGLGGLLVCNPVPEFTAVPHDEAETWVEAALAEARQETVAGKALTPFLLHRIAKASGGRSLAANRALLIDNARLGGTIAAALSRMERQT